MSEKENFPILRKYIEIDPKEEKIKKAREKETFLYMLEIYCHDHHQDRGKTQITDLDMEDRDLDWIREKKSTASICLCQSCGQLLKKSFAHTDKCPHSSYKTFCHRCPTRCYREEELEKIRPVMAYSGKKLIYRQPIQAFHFLKGLVQAKGKIRKFQKEQEKEA